jgi:hypothetical protein
VRLVKAQTFDHKSGATKALFDLIPDGIVSQQEYFYVRFNKCGYDVALQEVDNCQSVVSTDKYSFTH